MSSSDWVQTCFLRGHVDLSVLIFAVDLCWGLIYLMVLSRVTYRL